MWPHLHAALKQVFQEEEGSWSLAAARGAWEHLRQYAELAETNSFTSLLTPNLHYAVCRLLRQQEARGSICRSDERWVERFIRKMKEVAPNPPTVHAEQYIVDQLLRAETVNYYAPLCNLAQLEKEMEDDSEGPELPAGCIKVRLSPDLDCFRHCCCTLTAGC